MPEHATDAQTSMRHQLGQWFTPPAVADLVVALATEGRSGLDIVDPTCGDGVFLERARVAGGGRLRGLDIDPNSVMSARGRVASAEVACGSLFSVDPQQWMADAVIGNPPYVRQERLESHTKADGQRCLSSDWSGVADQLVALGKRADLAALCISRMLKMVKPGGRLGLVVSSALFDAGYARALWRGIEEVAAVVAVVESPDERWFADAAVNAVIIVLERGAESRRFPVARLRVPVDVAKARVRCVGDLDSVAEIRHAEPGRPESWAALIRAPSAWFELADAAGDALVPLGELAEVKRGITSGANDVFYLRRDEAEEIGLEPELLAPLVRSPREASAETISIDPQTTPSVALVVPDLADAAERYPVAWRYLMGRAEAAERPTLRARDPWWALPTMSARVFLTKAYGARFIQRYSPVPVVADQRVYALSPVAGVEPALLAAVLNSTYTALALESLGRASLGEGALEWTVGDAKRLPVLDPRRLPATKLPVVYGAFEILSTRAIVSVEGEAEHRDRRALDRAVGSVVGESLSDLDQAVWAGLIGSVARRHRKADS